MTYKASKEKLGCWRDGSMVKSTYCSCRRPESCSQVLSTHTRWFTTFCNFSFKGSYAFSGLHRLLYTPLSSSLFLPLPPLSPSFFLFPPIHRMERRERGEKGGRKGERVRERVRMREFGVKERTTCVFGHYKG